MRETKYPEHREAVKKVAEETGVSEEQVERYIRKFFGDSGLLRYFRRAYNVLLHGFGMFKMKPHYYRKAGGIARNESEEVKAARKAKQVSAIQKRSYQRRKAEQKARNFSLYWERIKKQSNNN